MSHFTVLVIGDDIESQLAPFHEFECTGEDDQYVQNVDRLAEARGDYEKYGKEGQTFAAFCEGEFGKTIAGDEQPDPETHKYGWTRVVDGEVTECIRRTNPNKHWDWWQVGGRWRGTLQLATGERVDSARSGDVAWDAMRDASGAKASAMYDKVHAVLAGRSFLSWPATREAHSGDIEAARKAYHAQDAVTALHQSKDEDLQWANADDFLVSRDAYVTAARNGAGVTFGVVKDSQWFERGRMGWWACVSDEKESGAWEAEFARLIDGLPADTMLTVVDCHI